MTSNFGGPNFEQRPDFWRKFRTDSESVLRSLPRETRHFRVFDDVSLMFRAAFSFLVLAPLTLVTTRPSGAKHALPPPLIEQLSDFRTTCFFNRCETKSATVHNSRQQSPAAPKQLARVRNSLQQSRNSPETVPKLSATAYLQQSRNSSQQSATVRNLVQQPETAPPPRLCF
jgi:hypothetical protein